MSLSQKDLLGLEKLPQTDINLILETAVSMKEIVYRPIKKVPTLRGKTVINMFFEPSTRTRTSFELAAKYLSADAVNISASASSVVKGESLKDTAQTIQALGADVVVLRHSMSGSPQMIAPLVTASVLNAGEGAHDHPTQALLDMFTVWDKLGSFQGLKIAIVGDVLHSRVARSDIWGFTKMGAEVWVCGPSTLMAPEIAP
ncbi:MAG: aspartate carbamoyltransferase, partial [Clostridia bacterium]|nr:aspartate carbamoyltransferase [Clostridia bacterium]